MDQIIDVMSTVTALAWGVPEDKRDGLKEALEATFEAQWKVKETYDGIMNSILDSYDTPFFVDGVKVYEQLAKDSEAVVEAAKDLDKYLEDFGTVEDP